MDEIRSSLRREYTNAEKKEARLLFEITLDPGFGREKQHLIEDAADRFLNEVDGIINSATDHIL